MTIYDPTHLFSDNVIQTRSQRFFCESMTSFKCEICNREFKTRYALNSHKNWHDPLYSFKCSNQSEESKRKSANLNKQYHAIKRQAVELEYFAKPKLCEYCNSEIPFEKKTNRYCNRSCAALYNNSIRSPESRNKQKQSVKKTFDNTPRDVLLERANRSKRTGEEWHKRSQKGRKSKPKTVREKTNHMFKEKPLPRIQICKMCNKEFRHINNRKKSYCSVECESKPKTLELNSNCKVCNVPINKNRVTCSDICLRLYHKNRMTNYLKDPVNRNKYGRRNRSYMESSFEKWLTALNFFKFEIEVQFKKYDESGKYQKCYYVDFLFEDLKFIIELDGNQHRLTTEADRIRDDYISSLGYQILRISHTDYQSRKYEEYIKERLGINS